MYRSVDWWDYAHEPKDGDNRVHPNVPSTWWIILYISINIHLEQQLSVTSIKPSRYEVESFPHAAQKPPHLTLWQMVCKEWWAPCNFRWNQLTWNFQREVNSSYSGPTSSLHNYGSFPERVQQFRVNRVFQNCISVIHSINTHSEWKKCVWERPTSQIACILKKGKSE